MFAVLKRFSNIVRKHTPFSFRNMSSSHEQINKIIADFVSNQNSMKSHESLEVKFRPQRTVHPDVIVISLPIQKLFTRGQTICTCCWTITRDLGVNFFHIS